MDKLKVYSYDVTQWLYELAGAKPDGYVYEKPGGSCKNKVKDEKGKYVSSCIIGSLFIDKLGVDANVVKEFGASGELVQQFQDRFTFSKRAMAIMRVAQIMQDQGVSWIQTARLADDLVHATAAYQVDVFGDEFPSDSE